MLRANRGQAAHVPARRQGRKGVWRSTDASRSGYLYRRWRQRGATRHPLFIWRSSAKLWCFRLILLNHHLAAFAFATVDLRACDGRCKAWRGPGMFRDVAPMGSNGAI